MFFLLQWIIKKRRQKHRPYIQHEMRLSFNRCLCHAVTECTEQKDQSAWACFCFRRLLLFVVKYLQKQMFVQSQLLDKFHPPQCFSWEMIGDVKWGLTGRRLCTVGLTEQSVLLWYHFWFTWMHSQCSYVELFGLIHLLVHVVFTPKRVNWLVWGDFTKNEFGSGMLIVLAVKNFSPLQFSCSPEFLYHILSLEIALHMPCFEHSG